MLLETSTSIIGIAKAILIVFQVLVCILLIIVVMMQRPKQEGLGAAFGGDTMDSLTGAHATDFMQKGTAFLGTALFIITFVLSLLVVAGNPNNNFSELTADKKEEMASKEKANDVTADKEMDSEKPSESATPVVEVPATPAVEVPATPAK